MNDIILSIKNVSKVYDKKKLAVDNFSLDIYRGETFGIVGESGCGKSTLANMLVNLVDVTSGNIFFEKEKISNLSKKSFKKFYKDLQIVFQDPYSSLNPKKKVGWLIEEPLRIQGLKNDIERKKRVQDMASDVGLSHDILSRYPSDLSGGQRQRVAIAIALISRPKFLICDEAVSALDVSIQAQILNLLKDLQKKYGLTYLFISHDLNVIAYMADRIGVMYEGKLLEVGKCIDIYNKPNHPYTKSLFEAAIKTKN